MKKPAPSTSDLLWERMEVCADAGMAIAEKAKARGGLTKMELCELKLLDIEQDQRRRRWAEELRSEGHYVSLLESRESPQTGITVNAAGRGRPQISIYGEIGEQFGGITADDLRRALAEVPPDADLELHVHSDGGSFSEGIAMRSLILNRIGRTFGIVDGAACSAATFPLMACFQVAMTTGSWLMIHECSASLKSGGADDFAAAGERLAETNRQIAAIYAERWKGTMASLLDALSRETWFSPEQAVEAGLADVVTSDLAIAASVSSRREYKNIPAPLTIAARAEETPILLAYGLAMHRCAIVH